MTDLAHTTFLLASNGRWSQGRSLSEAVQAIDKSAFLRGVTTLVFDVRWSSAEALQAARALDAQEASRSDDRPLRVNADGSPVATVVDGKITHPTEARPVPRGKYVHRTGKVVPHVGAEPSEPARKDEASGRD